MAASKTTRKRKRGRPPLPRTEGKRSAIGLRATAELRKRLEEAAKASGRSLSQEAELRLERTFLQEEIEHASFGGPARYRLMKWLAFSLGLVEDVTGKSWEKDRETFKTGLAAITAILERLTPKKAGGLSDEVAEKLGKQLGQDIVKAATRLSKN